MEHFFHTYVQWVRHHVKKLAGNLPPRHAITKFFESKNTRLAIILIITAAIPLTVLAVQQIQDIRQAARGTKAACDGTSTGLLAEPQPAEKGKTITFKHVGGLPPVTEDTFQNADFTGNGVDQKSCSFSGDAITCTARGTAKSGQSSFHTWKFRELAECEYEVKNTAPKPTPRPSGTRTTPPAGTTKPTPNGGDEKCTATFTADCDANNQPRLKASWTVKNPPDDKNCKISIKDTSTGKVSEVSTNCQEPSFLKTTLGGEGVKNNTKYEIILNADKNTTCKNQTKASATTSCKATTPTLTPGSGQATNTPIPGGGNVSPIPPTNLISNCDGTETGKNVELRWREVVGAESYVINVTEYKGSTKTAGPKTYTPTASTKPQGSLYIGDKNAGSNLRTTKGYTYTWEIATKIRDKTSTFAKGPDTTCTTQGLDEARRITPTPTRSPAVPGASVICGTPDTPPCNL